ncbi:hypothetical protein GOBAR_DD33245 [Gossypium barbadense]|nr:hypothetical protein GOBAR_DD33245 [Gossypium barbadense]
MEAVLALEKPRSWKDYLVGTDFQAEGKAAIAYNFDDDGDFELLYADVVRSSINDIPSINFSERVNQILIKDMAYTVKIRYPIMIDNGVNVMYGEVLRGVHINAIYKDTIEKDINDMNDTATDLESPFEQDMCLEGSHDFEDDIDRSLSPDLLMMVEQEENKFYLLKR